MRSPPDDAKPFLRATQEVALRPVSNPTPAQIRFVQGRFSHLGNFLQVRERLLQGGLGFGPDVPERLQATCDELRALELPFDVQPSRLWFDTRYNCFIAYVP